MSALVSMLSEDWLYGQRVALASSACASTADGAGGALDVNYAFLLFHTLLALPPGGTRPLSVRQSYKLPPIALSRLAGLALAPGAELWSAHAEGLKSAYEAQLWSPRGSRSQLAAAKLIADRLLRSDLPGARIGRLAAVELGRGSKSTWRKSAQLHRALESLNHGLRRRRDTAGRLAAIHRFRRAVTVPPAEWPMIEAALLQHILSWIPGVVALGGRATGHLIPVALDLLPEEVGESNGEIVRISGVKGDVAALRASLARAREAAINLWLSRFSFYPDEHRRAVAGAVLSLDLEIVNRITSGCTVGAAREVLGMGIHGRSLEAHVATVIYGRLLALPVPSLFCATGTLGVFLPNVGQDGGDTTVGPADDEDIKYAAANQQFFDRLLVSEGSTLVVSGKTAVSAGDTLSDLVDHAFGYAGRKHCWIRCPDLAADAKHRPPRDNAERAAALSAMRVGAPVNHIAVKVRALVQALMDSARLVANCTDTSEAFRHVPAFTVVRAVEGEAGERFWHTVWSAIDGDADEFARFCWAVSDQARGELLAKQLKRRPSGIEDPRRAPDVLVICGARHVSNSGSPIAGSPFARLDLLRVMKAANAFLKTTRSPDSPLFARIGRTRIVIIDDDGDDRPEDVELFAREGVDADLARHVRALSVFRYGFTFGMARRFLRDRNGNPLDEDRAATILTALLSTKTAGGVPLLQHGVSNSWESASRAFEYYLPTRVPVEANGADLAALHSRAAEAIAGFLSRDELAARFDYGVAMAPEWLHEAQYHLREARLLVPSGLTKGSVSLTRVAIDAWNQRLSRAGEYFGFSAVKWAVSRPNDLAEDLLVSYRAELRQRQIRHHPTHYLLGASAATALLRHTDAEIEQREKLGADVFTLLRAATSAVGELDDQVEADACRFLIETERCMALTEMEGDPAMVSAAFDRTLRLKDRAREVWHSEWFEVAGDRKTDPKQAAPIYRLGFLNDKVWGVRGLRISALVRWLGCLQTDWYVRQFDRLNIELSPSSVSWLVQNKAGEDDWPEHVRERWRTGIGRLAARKPELRAEIRSVGMNQRPATRRQKRSADTSSVVRSRPQATATAAEL